MSDRSPEDVSAPAHSSPRRFDAEDAAEASRNADGSASIATRGKGNDARGHGDAGSGRRPTRHVPRRMRIARHHALRVEPEGSHAVLGHHRRPEDNRPGRAQASDARSVVSRGRGVAQVAASPGRQSRDGRLLLDEHRYAVEDAERAARLPSRRGSRGLGARAVLASVEDGTTARSARGERPRPDERAFDDLGRRRRAGLVGGRQRGRRAAPWRRREREAGRGGFSRRAAGEGSIVDHEVAEQGSGDLVELAESHLAAAEGVEKRRAGASPGEPGQCLQGATGDSAREFHGVSTGEHAPHAMSDQQTMALQTDDHRPKPL